MKSHEEPIQTERPISPKLKRHAARLRQWMQENNLTQKEVADVLGIWHTSFNKACMGNSYLRARELAKLAEHYDLDLNWLLTGKSVGRPRQESDPPASISPESAADDSLLDAVADRLLNRLLEKQRQK